MWPTELFWACWRKSIFAYEPAGGLMKWCERILLILWLSFCFTIMSEGTLWAGDCSGPSDCGSVPDNGSRAAAAGAAAAGGGLAWRSRRNKKGKGAPPTKPGPCAQQQTDLSNAQSQRDMYKQQKEQYLNNMVADNNQMSSDNAAAQAALAALKDALGWNFASLVAEYGWPSDPAAFTTQQLQGISNTFGGGPAAQQVQAFVQAAQSLQRDIAQYNTDNSNYQQADSNYQDAAKAAAQAQQAYDNCVAAHQGDGSSAGAGTSDGGGAVSDAGAGDSPSAPS